MNISLFDFFDDRQKAIDHAVWMNFKYRVAKIVSGVIPGPEDNWAVCEEATALEAEMPFLNILPKNYSKLSYQAIDAMKMDTEPLPHWSAIIGPLQIMDGDILRFILMNKIPLKRLIRHELALRGFDKDHRWCGFDNARKIWLN